MSNIGACYELALELEKRQDAFMAKVLEVHRKPWKDLKNSALTEDHFSAVLHALDPNMYPEPLSWVIARSGSRWDFLGLLESMGELEKDALRKRLNTEAAKAKS